MVFVFETILLRYFTLAEWICWQLLGFWQRSKEQFGCKYYVCICSPYSLQGMLVQICLSFFLKKMHSIQYWTCLLRFVPSRRGVYGGWHHRAVHGFTYPGVRREEHIPELEDSVVCCICEVYSVACCCMMYGTMVLFFIFVGSRKYRKVRKANRMIRRIIYMWPVSNNGLLICSRCLWIIIYMFIYI